MILEFLRDLLKTALQLDWKVILPQPFVTTIGLIIENYSKILGAVILIMQIIYLYVSIQEKRKSKGDK